MVPPVADCHTTNPAQQCRPLRKPTKEAMACDLATTLGFEPPFLFASRAWSTYIPSGLELKLGAAARGKGPARVGTERGCLHQGLQGRQNTEYCFSGCSDANPSTGGVAGALSRHNFRPVLWKSNPLCRIRHHLLTYILLRPILGLPASDRLPVSRSRFGSS